MFKIKLIFALTFFLLNGVTTNGQPGPEYFILFDVIKNGKILNESNAKFKLYTSCNNKIRKLKQPSHLNTTKISSKNPKEKRQVRVLHQYINCEKIIVKIKYNKEEMEIHFWTDQSKIREVYGKYYIHDAIEFIPNKNVTFYLRNSFDDSLMGEASLGFSGMYHWVFSPTQLNQSLLSSRKAQLTVDTILLYENTQMSKVDFEIAIGLDSLNRRYPTFCYSYDAGQINYGFTFEIFRLNPDGKWMEASLYNDLNIRYTTLGPTCDFSKFVDDENAYEYFKLLNHRFSVNFYKPGTYKIVSKYDNLLSATFTISEEIPYKKK